MNLQLEQNYTPRQKAMIYAFMPSGAASLDKLQNAIESEYGRRISRQSAIRQLHNVAAKLAQDGYVILRKSGLGRGAKGEWVLTELTSKQQEKDHD